MKTLLVSMTAVALSTAAAQAATSATATTDLNLRAAPGPAAEVISVIPAQQNVAVNGCLEEANWCEVVLDGQTGWAYGDYLSVNVGDEIAALTAMPESVPVPVIRVEDTTAETALASGTVGAMVGAVVGGPVGAAVGGLAGAGVGAASDPGAHVETYVVNHPVEPVYLDGEVVVGAGLPGEVALVEIPDSDLLYANVNGLPVLVEPTDRRITYIVR